MNISFWSEYYVRLVGFDGPDVLVDFIGYTQKIYVTAALQLIVDYVLSLQTLKRDSMKKYQTDILHVIIIITD